MNETSTRWRAENAEADAAHIGGRPVHAFWPLLAPSFRHILLPPHRRAGGGSVTWEWSAPATAPRPDASQLAELRNRLLEAGDAFADDIGRRGRVPEGLDAADLIEGMEKLLRDLRLGPDTRLAAHAVRTEHGWMLRSWGFARPGTATVENGSDEAKTSTHAAIAAAIAKPSRPTSTSRQKRAGLIVGGIVSLLLVGWGLRARLRPSVSGTDTAETPSPPTAETSPNTPRPSVPAPRTSLQFRTATSAPPDGVFIPPVSPSSWQARDHAVPGIGAIPAALTGVMPTLPDAQIGLAGPPSDLPGRPGPEPAIAGPDEGKEPKSPDADKADDTNHTPAPPQGAPTPDSGASAAKPSSPQPTETVAESPRKSASANLAPPPAPPPSEVAAREPPAPDSLAPPLPGKTPESDAPSSPTASAPHTNEPSNFPQHRPDPTPHSSAKPVYLVPSPPPQAAPPPTETTATTTAPKPKPASASPSPLTMLFHGRAKPWRLELKRDRPLATLPTETNAADALRAARTETWRRLDESVPPAFRAPRTYRGWSLRLAPASNSPAPPPVWRDSITGKHLPRFHTDATEARLEWSDQHAAPENSVDLDASLIASDGRVLARARHGGASGRIELFITADVVAARSTMRLESSAAHIDVTAGWTLRRGPDGWEATGQILAATDTEPFPPSFAWIDADTGWALVGGVESGPPPAR